MNIKHTLSRRRLLAGSGALAVTSLGVPSIARAQSRQIVVAGPAAQAKVLEGEVFPLIAKKIGAEILFEGGTSVKNLQLLIAQKDAPRISVVMMVDSEQLGAHQRGLLVAPSLKTMKNIDSLIPEAVMYEGAWIRHKISRFAVATNPTQPAIKSWAELWDPRYKSKILAPAFPLTQGPYLLIMASHLATGKPFAQAQYDPEPGFAKLRALRPNLLNVYSNAAQAMSLVETGEAVAGIGLFSGTVFPRKSGGASIDLPMLKEGAFGSPDSSAKIKGAPAGALADAFIDEMLSPEIQTILSKRFSETPVNKRVPIGADVVPRENLIITDFAWVSTNRARLADAYAAALG